MKGDISHIGHYLRHSGVKDETLTVSNATHLRIAEDGVLVVVRPVTSLLDKSRWQTVGIRPIVGQLVVHIVVNLNKPNIFSIVYATKTSCVMQRLRCERSRS